MKIIFCHHALRKKGTPPSQNDDLEKLGEQDASLTSQILQKYLENNNAKITAIFTAKNLRCKKTAEIINQKFNAKIFEEKNLDEYNSAVETWLNAQNRTEKVIDKILNSFSDDDAVLIVTSGVQLAVFISRIYKIPLSKNTPFIGVPSCSPLIFDIKK